jgi:hypothetical protein
VETLAFHRERSVVPPGNFLAGCSDHSVDLSVYSPTGMPPTFRSNKAGLFGAPPTINITNTILPESHRDRISLRSAPGVMASEFLLLFSSIFGFSLYQLPTDIPVVYTAQNH